MAKPNAGSSGMAMVMNGRPHLFAMGGLRAPTKDFIQFITQAKKIINLMRASILFNSLPLPNSPPPERSNITPPALSAGHAFFPIYPPSLPRVFGWLLHSIVDWWPPMTTTNFVFHIFCPSI